MTVKPIALKRRDVRVNEARSARRTNCTMVKRISGGMVDMEGMVVVVVVDIRGKVGEETGDII